MKRPPKCRDCGCTSPRPNVSEGPHAWRCLDCGLEYGYREKPYKLLPARTAEEWLPLLRSMLPTPIETKGGELWGGAPPTVIVAIRDDKIHIMQVTINWDTHEPRWKQRAFASRPLRAPAADVARLINAAHAKRLGEYRWCPRCRRTLQPERICEGVCHSCAERELGVVF